MARQDEPYREVSVESFKPLAMSGLDSSMHIRLVKGQGMLEALHVECSKKLSCNYLVSTKLKIKAKLTDRESGG